MLLPQFTIDVCRNKGCDPILDVPWKQYEESDEGQRQIHGYRARFRAVEYDLDDRVWVAATSRQRWTDEFAELRRGSRRDGSSAEQFVEQYDCLRREIRFELEAIQVEKQAAFHAEMRQHVRDYFEHRGFTCTFPASVHDSVIESLSRSVQELSGPTTARGVWAGRLWGSVPSSSVPSSLRSRLRGESCGVG